MEKYIHIVLENGAQAAVIKSHAENNRKGLKENIKEFLEDLSIGPIKDYETNKETREEWLKEVLEVRVPDYDFTVEETLANLTRLLPVIEQGEKIVIWHGKSAKEILNLCYLVTYFKDYEVYEADITKHIKLKEENKVHYMTRLMQCGKKQLAQTLDNLTPMSEERKLQLIEQWKLYQNLPGEIRVIEADGVVGKAIDYYDALILQQVEEGVEKQIDEIVGGVILDIEETMGDRPSKLLLEYRIKALVEAGKLIITKNHPQIAKISIKSK